MILKARWLSTSHLFPEALIHWEVYIDLRTQISQIMSEVSGFKMPLFTAKILVDSRSCLVLSNSNWAQHRIGQRLLSSFGPVARTPLMHPASSHQSTWIYHCTCTKSNQPVLHFFAGKSTLLIFPRVLNLKLYTCTAGAQPCSALLGMPGAPSAECLEPLQGTHHFSCFEHLKGESFVKAM